MFFSEIYKKKLFIDAITIFYIKTKICNGNLIIFHIKTFCLLFTLIIKLTTVKDKLTAVSNSLASKHTYNFNLIITLANRCLNDLHYIC